MDKKKGKAFNKLLKVETLNQMIEFDNDGKVTRSLKSDHERTIRLIAYGFLEGINYVKNSKGVEK